MAKPDYELELPPSPDPDRVARLLAMVPDCPGLRVLQFCTEMLKLSFGEADAACRDAERLISVIDDIAGDGLRTRTYHASVSTHVPLQLGERREHTPPGHTLGG